MTFKEWLEEPVFRRELWTQGELNMYSIKEFLKQEPAVIKAAILSVIAAVIAIGGWSIHSDILIPVGVAFETVLGLFYVRGLSTSKSWAEEQKWEALDKQQAEITAYLYQKEYQAETPPTNIFNNLTARETVSNFETETDDE